MSDEEVRTEADPEETELSESTEGVESDFTPFDEIREDYKPSAIPKITGVDGMPTNHVERSGVSDIPVLSPETLVCMGEFHTFVGRDSSGKITQEYPADKVVRTPNGHYVYTDEKGGTTYVQPIRPPCKHYVRQMGAFELNAQHDVVYRLCAARRTTEGTFMTLRDSKISACSMRDPIHLESEKLLDEFDKKKIEQGKQRENYSIFDLGEKK